MKRISFTIFAALVALFASSPVFAQDSDFYAWVSNFRTQAFRAGVSAETINANFRDLEFIQDVIYKDRNQPEFKLGLDDYMRRVISPARISTGREKIAANKQVMDAAEKKYGVPKSVITALWGIETNYGKSTGGYHVLSSLATLAYEGRRSEYFTKEFIATLLLADKHRYIQQPLTGSWAGALGQCQFMPSTYLQYAVDGNDNGKVDLWNEVPDVIASAANYLSQSGWKSDQPIAESVQITQKIDDDQLGLNVKKSVADWNKSGVKFKSSIVVEPSVMASLIVPNGGGGKAFLVFDNYRAIMTWNRSHNFALTVTELARKIASTPQKSGQKSS